jgi:hypothetical protein
MLDRSLGQPQSTEDEVLSDGWPFRMSAMNEKTVVANRSGHSENF